MSYAIRPLRYTAILESPKASQLLSEYSEECSIPEIGHTNPQADLYEKMESSGLMRCFGIFWEDSLVGFAATLFYVLPHYGRKIASIESLFLEKSHRSGGAGVILMKKLEEEAKSSGCVAVLYSAPTGSKLEKLLSIQKNCRRTNAVFTRKLND